ncbi:MAG: GAF domain-containing protein [Anaerolineales bacterium]|jgi:GAF domain-containing protein
MLPEQPRTKMGGFLERLVRPNPSIRELGARRQAQFLCAAALTLAFAAFLVMAFLGLVFRAVAGSTFPTFLASLFLAVICLLAYGFGRMRHYQIGSAVLTFGLTALGYWLVLNGQPLVDTLFSLIPLAFILGMILLPFWGMIVLVAINALTAYLLTALPFPIDRQAFSTASGVLLAVGIFLLIAAAFRNIVERQRLEDTLDTNRKLLELRDTLVQQLDQRTRQVRIASECAKKITAFSSLDDLLRMTAELLTERCGYYHAGIYLVDELGRFVQLRAAGGTAAEAMLRAENRFAVGPTSILGWAIAHKEPRLAANVADDSLYQKNELLPETRSEAGVPILAGEQVLGGLDVHSTDLNAFDPGTLAMLQTLAAQLASAMQNVRLMEATQVNLQGVGEVYQTSFQIAQAKTEAEVYSAAKLVFQRTPYQAILLVAEKSRLRAVAETDPSLQIVNESLPLELEVAPGEGWERIAEEIQIGEVSKLTTLPGGLLKLLQKTNLTNVALLPVTRNQKLAALLVVGGRSKQPLSPTSVKSYLSLAELIVSAIERIRAEQDIERRLEDLEAITVISQAISTASDLPSLYGVLHDQIRQHMGDNNFLVALYEPGTDSISIPYLYELDSGHGQTSSLESFPLGEGLTSILIRTKQPMMLLEETERRAAVLGAKVIGKPAKSWLGAPLIVAGEVVGAIIVQDTEHEHAFDEADLRFLTTLASQVAGAIYNVRLLDGTRQRALQLQTAAEIARDISGSLDLNQLLAEAVSLIRERFNFYHAAIFLVEPNGEYAAVREATGEAGAQMKHAGHRLKVGSKSIVGYVTGNGEPLVVNDTSQDAIYYPNPLLPDTRAEIAIPLKVGTRIVGALDVQSTHAYSFSDENVNVLRILADQLAVAVINSELFAETQEHLSQHRLLHHVTTAAASGTTIEEALNSATQGLQVTLGGDRVAILLANKEKKLLEVKSVAGYSEEVKQVVIPYGSGITGAVANQQQPLRIDDVTQDPRYIQVASNVRSELAIPLLYRSELLGVLNVESDQIGAYSESDEELLGTLGGSLAAIIANARLLDQIRRQVDRERLLYEITSKIRRSTDMQTIMSTTTSELSRVFGARRAEIKINVNRETKNSSPKDTA